MPSSLPPVTAAVAASAVASAVAAAAAAAAAAAGISPAAPPRPAVVSAALWGSPKAAPDVWKHQFLFPLQLVRAP